MTFDKVRKKRRSTTYETGVPVPLHVTIHVTCNKEKRRKERKTDDVFFPVREEVEKEIRK